MVKMFKVELNKPALSYSVGEKIQFKVFATNDFLKVEQPNMCYELTTDDGKREWGYVSTSPKNPFVVETELSRPGFVHLVCTACDENLAPISDFEVLHAGAGADVEKITYADTLPEDFDKYWDEIKEKISAFTPEIIEKTEIRENIPEDFLAYDVRISTPFDTVGSGCLTIPKNAADESCSIRISFMGYGIAGAAPKCIENTITLIMNAHGIENQNAITRAETMNKYKNLQGYGFNAEENVSPYTTYWRNMHIRNLSALKMTKLMPQWNGKYITASGGSQGAFQATAVAAHGGDVTMLEIDIPWFCNIGAEQNGYLAGWRPKFAEGLRYFDTVANATRVKCPVKISAGLGDYTCPPHSVMALYNVISTEKRITFFQGRTHGHKPLNAESFYLESDSTCGEIKLGKYRHYKGGEYEVIDIAKNSEDLKEVVVYKSLADGDVWARPKEMWNEMVLDNGKPTKRFTYIGE